MGNIRRRSFLKGLVGVVLSPLAAIAAPIKKLFSIDLDQPVKWKNHTYSYDPDMIWPTADDVNSELGWANYNFFDAHFGKREG